MTTTMTAAGARMTLRAALAALLRLAAARIHPADPARPSTASLPGAPPFADRTPPPSVTRSDRQHYQA